MTLQDILHEAQALPAEERRELIKLLIDTLGDPDVPSETESTHGQRSLFELAGLGAEIWQEIDAQDYVDQLRNEWNR